MTIWFLSLSIIIFLLPGCNANSLLLLRRTLVQHHFGQLPDPGISIAANTGVNRIFKMDA